MTPFPTADSVFFGGDYNPEQWPEEVWADDLAAMSEAGVTLVTVGVFAWARLEPSQGVFDFGWLDRLLDGLHSAGIRVDLATATASPPPWLSHAHPDALPVTADGVRLSAGSRQAYCPSSPVYRRAAARLVTALVERYATHPALEWWHVNNEYGCHVSRCYCEVSAEAFRGWLERRYSSIDALNTAWGTAFWSQHYSSFAEVEPPRAMPTLANPTQQLDFDRFSSDELLDLFRQEAEIVRASSDRPLTTNFMGAFKPLDYWAWAAEVDFVSDDTYADPADPTSPATAALAHDLMRSLGGGRPWVQMEQASAAVNWRLRNAPKPPGANRAGSYQSVARGADAVLYFQWRQSAAGSEKFHSAMLPHAGTETRIYREIARLGAEFGDTAVVGGLIGAPVAAHVALVLDWPSWWAIEQEASPATTDYLAGVAAFHAALFDRDVTVDFVPAGGDLSRYDLVIVSRMFVVTDEIAASFSAYVESGGHLVVTNRTGVVDADLHLSRPGYLGGLAALVGVRVEEFWPLPTESDTVPLVSRALPGLVARDWTEALEATDSEVIARIATGILADHPALTRRSVGEGEGVAWYLAADLEPDSLGRLLDHLLVEAEVPRLPTVPPGVESVRRGDTLVLINHSHSAVAFVVAGTSSAPAGTSVELEPFGVALLPA